MKELEYIAHILGAFVADKVKCPSTWLRIRHRNQAILKARELLASSCRIVDTETTGLGPKDEVIEISIVDMNGNVLFDSLARPKRKSIPAEASAIHGITYPMVKLAPEWPEVWNDAQKCIDGVPIVCYNLAFDARLIKQTCEKWGIKFDLRGFHHCAMMINAAYRNEWNDYRGSYKWPKLESAEHRALGDTKATLEVLREIARAELGAEPHSEKPWIVREFFFLFDQRPFVAVGCILFAVLVLFVLWGSTIK